MSTVKELLLEKNNDYSCLEDKFNSIPNIELLSYKNYKLKPLKDGNSIIIPSFSPLFSYFFFFKN